MSRLLKGDADGTALRLTQVARETLNARLFGLAESLAIKHRDRLSDASMSLILQAQEVRQKFCSRGTQVSLARMAEAQELEIRDIRAVGNDWRITAVPKR